MSEQRKERIAELVTNDPRVLVATDCLSEGANLQDHFDAVVHYDLPWNPNRLEQREGRVDRFGQPKPSVRTVLLYGSNNPVDQVVLDVLIRAEALAGYRYRRAGSEGFTSDARIRLSPASATRCCSGPMFSDSVTRWTALVLLRFRYRFIEEIEEFAEEIVLAVFERGERGPRWL